ncbi:MAG: flagellar biosynthetic protein FliO [Desulfuromonadales bacterium]|nr:flagellar biosynthetic protein FliO [Desulfuromonadales bacterium]MDW7757258.1 flagellar biosynthetic protein FliO [Desulfuromonadales bacterium]
MTRLFFAALWLWPSLALAADSGSLLASSLKMLAALGVVLGLVLLLYAASRKGFGFLPAAKGGAIKIVEMRHLAPRKAVCLVEVRGREFLLGVGNDRVELLTPLDRREGQASFEEKLCTEIESGR